MLLPEDELLNENLSARHGLPPYELLVEEAPENTGSCHYSWFLTIAKREDLIAEDTTHFDCRKTDQEISCNLALTVQEVAIQAAAGRETISVASLKQLSLHATIPTCQSRYTHWCNGGTKVMGVANCFWLDLRPIPQKGI